MRRLSFGPWLSVALALLACGKSGGSKGSDQTKGLFGDHFLVQVSPPQGGAVRSTDGRIQCASTDATCPPVRYGWNETATLRAAPDPGYVFVMWLGACAGEGDCVLDRAHGASADQTVVAVFARTQPNGAYDHPNYNSVVAHAPAYYQFLAWRDAGAVPPVPPGTRSCTACHGANLTGVGIAPSCDSCHAAAGDADWRTKVRAHQLHLNGARALTRAISCDDCHAIGASISFAWSLRATAGGAASYDAATGTCTNNCHGATLRAPDGSSAGGTRTTPAWLSFDATVGECGSCHGVPPPAPHYQGTRCGSCHGPGYSLTSVNPVTHIDGVVQGATLGCTSCHGGQLPGLDVGSNPVAAAPPVDLSGSDDPSRPGNGAHAAHLLPGTLRQAAIPCAECHVVPSGIEHANAPLDLTWGALARSGSAVPTWNAGGHTCTNYCHGATLPGGGAQPVWTSLDGTYKKCDSCHGNPPPFPHLQRDDCGTCHAGYAKGTSPGTGTVDVATHLNGTIDFGVAFSCTSCHGDPTRQPVAGADPNVRAAPPLGVELATTTANPGVGAHAAHVNGGRSRPVACAECHAGAVPAAVTGDPRSHVRYATTVAFGPLARQGAYDVQGLTCSSTYCHGNFAGGNGGGATPRWTTAGTLACTSCHGNPPTANGHPARTDCDSCHGDGFPSGQVDAALHVNGTVDFSPAFTCAACHADLQTAMSSGASYGHFMAASAPYGAPYPTNNSPAAGSPDRRCTMCHTNHLGFAGGSTLRADIRSSVAAAGDDAALCTSCHLNEQVKAGQPLDGTQRTAGWADLSGWAAGGHNYQVAGAFPAGAAAAGSFDVNCTKCHNSSSTQYQGNGSARFALHASSDRRLRAPLGRDAVPDDEAEAFCYRCHSNLADRDSSGNPLPGTPKPADLKDWYGGRDMPNGSTGIFAQMSGTPALPTNTSNTLNVKPAAQEPVTGNQPGGPSAENVGKVATNTLYLSSTPSAGPPGYLLSSGTYVETTLRQHAMTIGSNASASPATFATTSGQTNYGRVAQFLSPPVAAPFTWSSGAGMGLNLSRSESATSANCFFRYAVYRWSGGGAIQIVSTATGGTEFPTTAGTASQTMSTSGAVSFAAGDQILVEVEVYKNAPTAAGTCTVTWGNQAADASRLTLPATSTGTFPEFQGTNPPQGGTWVAKSMSPLTATGASESVTGTGTTSAYSTQLWERVSFVSPSVSAPATLPASAWSLNVLAGRGSLSSNTAYLRYRVYQWTAANQAGLEIVPWTTSSTALGSSVANVAITTPPGAAVTLSPGDKVVVELEIETMNTTASATANASISTNGTNVVLPAAVTWAYTTPGVVPVSGHMGARYAGLHKPNPAEENLQVLAANEHVECSDCHDAHQARRGNQADGGTATAASSTTITDANQGWAPNSWKGFYVDVTSGTGSGGRAQITGNTATQLTFATLGTAPAAGSGYRIAMKANGGAVTAATATTLTDGQSAVGGAKAWQANAFAGWQASIVLGTGVGQSATIASNTSNQLTLDGTWATTPDTTSRYVISKLPGVLAGATGVRVVAWGSGTPTAWGEAKTFDPAAGGTTPIPEATAQWQVCFKCHSSANPNVASWKAGWTDLSAELDPRNQSYHPIVAPAAAVSGTAGYGNTQLTASQLNNGWKPGDVMHCSDCHGNPDGSYGASQGPHASAVSFVLRGPRTRWPFRADGSRWTISNSSSSATGKDGLFCLNCHPALGGVHTTESAHESHACTECHIRIPHGGKVKRLMRTTNTPAPYADTGAPAIMRAYAGGTSSGSSACGVTCTTRHNLSANTTNSW